VNAAASEDSKANPVSAATVATVSVVDGRSVARSTRTLSRRPRVFDRRSVRNRGAHKAIDDGGTAGAPGWGRELSADVLRKYGAVTESMLPFKISTTMYTGSENTFYATAATRKVASYFNLRRNLANWRSWLAQNGPRCGSPTPASAPSGTGAASTRVATLIPPKAYTYADAAP
jgi:hypothetical protein